MSSRLIVADIPSLQALTERINAQGHTWYRDIRQLGAVQAGRIVSWLQQHEATLGPVQPEVERPQRAAATAIVPLESFLVPSQLSGAEGANRFPGKCRISAADDHQAIAAWLEAVSRNENTRRAYRRESERLLLWAILERGKALASLSVEDAAAHGEWLAALGRTDDEAWPWLVPQARWLGPRNTPRWSEEWRPYEGALSLRSQQQSFVVLKAMFEWLVKMRYLDSNPWDGVARPKTEAAGANPELELTHMFTHEQWAFLQGRARALPADAAGERMRFILEFAYATGLRISELVDAKVGRLYFKPLKAGGGVRWMLKVLGKGQKWRVVPMPTPVMDQLARYFALRVLPDPRLHQAEIDAGTPLVGALSREGEALTASALYKTLKRFFVEAAGALRDAGRESDAAKVAQASTHWLRHTRGSHSAGVMPINMLQRLLGHASLATTTIYTNVDEEELYEEMERELA